MGAGKLASQAGHAYLSSFIAAQTFLPSVAASYAAESPGTKVCLSAPTLESLLRALEQARSSGIPYALITDSGHSSFFDGQPTITALGLGPARRDQVKHITRQFKLLT